MRRQVKGLVIGLAAVGFLAAACGSSGRGTGAPSTTASSTSTTSTSTTTPTTSTTRTASPMDVRIYFLFGDHISVAHRTVAATSSVATAAMTELLSGPNSSDRTAGLSTAVPAGTKLLGINIEDGVATVDLTGIFASGGGSLSMTSRLAQVTYTLTQFPTINAVVFHLDGKPVTVFGGEGILLDHPASRASFESVTPAILVEFPGRGWAVHSPIRVAGTANVFEAQFQAELTDSRGTVIASQTVHATSGTGTRGTFDVSVSYPGNVSGPAILTLFDTSAKDGSRTDVVTVPLQLAGG